MTEDQLRKLDYLFYMTIANSQFYSNEDRQVALNRALNISQYFGIMPVMEQPVVQSVAAREFIDNPNELDTTRIV